MSTESKRTAVARGYFSESAREYYHEGGAEFVCSAVVNARDFDRVSNERDAVVDRLRVVGAERDALAAKNEELVEALTAANETIEALYKGFEERGKIGPDGDITNVADSAYWSYADEYLVSDSHVALSLSSVKGEM